MAANNKRYWGVITPLPAPVLTMQAKMAEDAGLEVVPDQMVEAFVACGTVDEVRKKLEPLWDVADSLCPVPPVYGLSAEKLMAYGGGIASAFYG